MTVLVRFTPEGLTAERYSQILRRLEESGHWPPDGLNYHCCFGSEGNLRVSEVWDSEEQLRAFGEHLMPVLDDVGIQAGEPELLEVHNIERR